MSFIIISKLLCIVLNLGAFIIIKVNKEEASFDDDTSSSKHIVNEQTLSMMIEKTAGAGDYKLEERTSWPTDGYMFNATLSKCENGGELGWDEFKGVITMTGNMSDKCYIYFDVFDPKIISDVCSNGDNLASCLTELGNKGKSSSTNIYYHDSTLSNGAGDNSYRYAGASASVNNYVCFGSTESICPTDNLYRIIGVFNQTEDNKTVAQVKLIKSTAASSTLLETDGDYYSSTAYYWNYKASLMAENTWSTSLLNKTNLNTNYINYIGSTWASKIATTTWKAGGNTSANINYVVPATAYANEITSPVTTKTTDNATTYSAKIGLMYVSDYGFAADPSAWTTNLSSYSSYKWVNWMYLGSTEWTISRGADFRDYAFFVDSSGSVDGEFVNTYLAVRPVFYLVSTATYSNGTGTNSDSIILID